MATTSWNKPKLNVKKTPASANIASQKKDEPSLQNQWDTQLESQDSQDLLGSMAAKALKEHKSGKTERGGFGK